MQAIYDFEEDNYYDAYALDAAFWAEQEDITVANLNYSPRYWRYARAEVLCEARYSQLAAVAPTHLVRGSVKSPNAMLGARMRWLGIIW